jgi:plastocyanin
MEEREDKPGTLTLATLILVGLLVPILIASFLVFGLQSPLAPPGASTTNSQTGVVVNIPPGVGSDQTLNFAPARMKVVVGVNNTIEWIQKDSIPHTVTSTIVPNGASSFDSKSMNKGDSFSVTLSVPGTYEYDCVYHPGWMKGSITVLAPGSSSTSTGAAKSVGVILPNGVGANPNLNFKPVNIVVVIGVNNTVQWIDQDPTPHTVTSTSVPTGAKAFDSGTINLGNTFTVTFTVPGTYKYHCTLHPGWMLGSIEVRASP